MINFTIKEKVKNLLEKYPHLRDSDEKLTANVWFYESQVAIDELKMAIEVNEWARQYKPRMICFDKYATMSVAERLSQSGHKIQDMSGTVFYQACSDLYDAIVNGRLVHAGQQTLVDSMNNFFILIHCLS